jgi:Na+/H+-dicarboxylate symporter
METISKLVPYFIFMSVLGMIISDNFSILVQAYKILLVTVIGYVVAIAFYVGMISLRKKVSPILLLKKLSQTFFIAVSTASSSAAFASNMETCEKKLGIDKRIVNFGVPMGQIIYMIGGCILFMTAAMCMAEVYGVTISLNWLVTALFISVVLAIATPPIPGGSLTCYTLLFLQLNIPAEAVPIIIAVEVIMDFICTAVNLLCLQTELVELAGDLNMLDYEKLRKEMK